MMEMVELQDVCKIIAGQSPPSSTYNKNGIGVPFFQGKADFGNTYPTVRYWCSAPKKISIPNDILFSVRAPVGSTNINNIKACIGRGLSAIRCGEKIDLKFLLHYLRANEHKIAALGTGSTFKAITIHKLKTVKIPLPPISEQKRIAAILDEADKLRRFNQQVLEKYDDLTQAVFLEMFGDPVRNPMGWEKVRIESVISKIESGWSPVCENKKRNTEEEWAILKLGAVTYRKYNPKEHKMLFKDSIGRTNIEVKAGDLLFSRKNTYSLVGACAYVYKTPKKLMLPDTIFRLKYEIEKINPVYFWYLMNNVNFRKEIQRLASGTSGSMPNISKYKLLKKTFFLPPLSLQNQFATRIENIEVQKTKAQAVLAQSEDLFNALLQKVFSGGL